MYPILLDLGFWQLRSYGIVVAIALLVGIWWSAREAERRGFSRALVYDLAWVASLAGFAGARLWFAFFSEPALFLAEPWEIFAVWRGGLAFQGALVGGFLAGLWFIRRRALPFWRLAGAVVPGLALGQAVGQIACLLNGDSYGKPTTVSWAIVYTHPQALAPLGVPLHPVEVYELVGYFLVFLVVQRVARSAGREGQALVVYAVLYGVTRFAMEFFRGAPPVVAGILVPQAVSVLLVAAGLIGAWLGRQLAWRSDGRVGA